jgi:hypothetical protein
MNDKQLADAFEAGKLWVGGTGDVLPGCTEQIIAALRRGPEPKRVMLDLDRGGNPIYERPPSGEMVMVPREPTEAMLRAAQDSRGLDGILWNDVGVWNAIIAAAEAEGRGKL